MVYCNYSNVILLSDVLLMSAYMYLVWDEIMLTTIKFVLTFLLQEYKELFF